MKERDRGIQRLEPRWRISYGGTKGQMGEIEEERREEAQVRVKGKRWREREKK